MKITNISRLRLRDLFHSGGDFHSVLLPRLGKIYWNRFQENRFSKMDFENKISNVSINLFIFFVSINQLVVDQKAIIGG